MDIALYGLVMLALSGEPYVTDEDAVNMTDLETIELVEAEVQRIYVMSAAFVPER